MYSAVRKKYMHLGTELKKALCNSNSCMPRDHISNSIKNQQFSDFTYSASFSGCLFQNSVKLDECS